MRRIIISFLVILIIVAPALAESTKPMDTLKAGIDQIIAILKDPKSNEVDQKKEQQKKLIEIVNQVFDFREFSKRVLARSWRNFTPEQRDEFTDVFSTFLCAYYIKKAQEKYTDEKIKYLGQKLTSNARAVVKTHVLWKGQEVPVDYRMRMADGSWQIYDLVVQGVSATKNYRAQFKNILLKESPAQLIERMKKKIEAIDKEKESGEG